MSKKGFDNVASFYDLLATLVFGKQLRKAQLHFLDSLPSNARILILGGGTGWLLKALLTAKEVKEVIYIDASQKMLDLTFQKNQESPQFEKVQLIHGTEEEANQYQNIDVLITPFILDVFTAQYLPIAIQNLSKILKKNGTWLLVDFDAKNTAKGISKAFVQLMYWFFTWTCSIPAKKLEDFEKEISHNYWNRIEAKYFYFNLVKAVLLKNREQ
ncbi:MAG: class I SAM-dependent methyltransferase [Cytophagales bacterium]|nr:class I SAM-dependent methyltransferase [Cytophagales bacterium]